MKHSLSVILILTTATLSAGIGMNVQYKWKYVDFWKNGNIITCGENDTNACALYDVDKAEDGRTFVTAVRDRGVQATLATVSEKMGKGGPLLQPYPNWEWNEYDYDTEPDCDKTIISVYRVSIKCNHIFVLDCGNNGEENVCPPKLLIFDLKDNKLFHLIQFPSNMFKNDSLFVTPLAYVRNCKRIIDATVYMADITGFGLVKYNKKSGFCRMESEYMKPTNTNFTIENEDFELYDGILGLTTIGKKLYYGVLGGNSMYKMNMCIHNEKCSELTENEANDLTQLAGTLSGQTAAIASEQCAILFSNIPETSILCQDTSKEFNSTNTELVVQDSEKLQFISGMKVIKKRWWTMLSNRFQLFFNNKANPNETNFRILNVDMNQVREKTNCFASCEEPGHGRPGHGRPGKPGHSGLGHGRPGKPGHGGPGHGRPGKPEHGEPGHGRPGKLEHGEPGHGRPDKPGHSKPEYGRLGYDKPAPGWYDKLLYKFWIGRSWECSDEHNKSSEEHDEHNKKCF